MIFTWSLILSRTCSSLLSGEVITSRFGMLCASRACDAEHCAVLDTCLLHSRKLHRKNILRVFSGLLFVRSGSRARVDLCNAKRLNGWSECIPAQQKDVNFLIVVRTLRFLNVYNVMSYRIASEFGKKSECESFVRKRTTATVSAVHYFSSRTAQKTRTRTNIPRESHRVKQQRPKSWVLGQRYTIMHGRGPAHAMDCLAQVNPKYGENGRNSCCLHTHACSLAAWMVVLPDPWVRAHAI